MIVQRRAKCTNKNTTMKTHRIKTITTYTVLLQQFINTSTTNELISLACAECFHPQVSSSLVQPLMSTDLYNKRCNDKTALNADKMLTTVVCHTVNDLMSLKIYGNSERLNLPMCCYRSLCSEVPSGIIWSTTDIVQFTARWWVSSTAHATLQPRFLHQAENLQNFTLQVVTGV